MSGRTPSSLPDSGSISLKVLCSKIAAGAGEGLQMLDRRRIDQRVPGSRKAVEQRAARSFHALGLGRQHIFNVSGENHLRMARVEQLGQITTGRTLGY